MKLLSILSITFILMFSVNVFAHDGSYDVNIVSWNSHEEQHDEPTEGPFKGWAIITINNFMTADWGDFHFQLCPTDVIFSEAEGNFQMLLGGPSGTPYSGYSYSIGDPDSYKVDFTFYGNPVENGETVTFKIYTDNTANQNAWFTLCMNPTPVPEPATVALLGFGALALIRSRRR